MPISGPELSGAYYGEVPILGTPFGNLDTVLMSLTRILQPEKLALTNIVASGAFLSYPAWLLRTLAD